MSGRKFLCHFSNYILEGLNVNCFRKNQYYGVRCYNCDSGVCRKTNHSMECTGYKVFNDSVHGHITLHPLLVTIVDTPEFQRLRNIKQLGFAYYVFPGAGHCRFEHSLGTCYLAGQMMEKLMSRECQSFRTQKERNVMTLCVQLAALCHDLGHGPYSHTWETVTNMWGDSWKHEEASCEMFDYILDKHDMIDDFGNIKNSDLGNLERKLIKRIIKGGPIENEKCLNTDDKYLAPEYNFLYEIVSSKSTGIDVDKWDYFLRDGLHLNLHITFDYRRLLEFCTILEVNGCTHLAFRDKEIMNLYDVYRVRSALHNTAYRHKVVLNIELMCIDAFKAAGDAGYKINNSSVELKDAHKSPKYLSEMTDHLFYDILYSKDKSLHKAQSLLSRVLQRQMYTFIGQAKLQLPHKDRQAQLLEKKRYLIDSLNEIAAFDNEFRVMDFCLNLDIENDPVSRVTFYQKIRGTRSIQQVNFETIKSILDPFPFQLAKETTALLYVFCTSESLPEVQLVKAKEIIKEFEAQLSNF